MRYLYWFLGVVVVGGVGVAGYYYGPGWLDTFNQNTHKNNEADISSPHSDTNLPSSNNWDYLIQAANAGNNAKLLASVPLGTASPFGTSSFNEYKISNVASNGDVTFEYKVISVDIKISETAKQDMLDEGYTEAEIAEAERAALVDLGVDDVYFDRFVGHTKKSIFTRASFISMIEDWKVGSFSIGSWDLRPYPYDPYAGTNSSPSPDYIKSVTIQCTNNDWNCLIQAANAGNNARLVATSVETSTENLGPPGVTATFTQEYKISNVASNGDVDFGYAMISTDIKISERTKQYMLDEGYTEADIARFMKGESMTETVGYALKEGTFTKTSFISLIKECQPGGCSMSDFINALYDRGAWELPSSDDTNVNTNTSTNTNTGNFIDGSKMGL